MKYFLLSTQDSASRSLFEKLRSRKNEEWKWLTQKDDIDLNIDDLPFAQKAFVFRWPHLLDENVLALTEFIGFHTSNLPEGRGGSPLQNQIMDDIYESRINALKLVKEADAGPVYTYRDVSLHGSIDDVWRTLSTLAYEMIQVIIDSNLTPQPQDPGVYKTYKRRRNNSLSLMSNDSIESVFRFIQMLDGEGYPQAFLDMGDFKIEFSRASMRSGTITCDARITTRTTQ